MLSMTLLQKVQASHDRWETPILWMYLDSEGYVTVGCGTLLPNAASSKIVSFFHVKTLIPATAKEIEDAWKKLQLGSKKQQAAPNNKKLAASSYEKETDLRITLGTSSKLRDKHISDDYQQLKMIYPNFDTFPENAKIALFDMIYNLGAGRYKTAPQRATGLRQYAVMNRAVNTEDWATAARNCYRNGISVKRNTIIANYFKSCIVKKTNTPDVLMRA